MDKNRSETKPISGDDALLLFRHFTAIAAITTKTDKPGVDSVMILFNTLNNPEKTKGINHALLLGDIRDLSEILYQTLLVNDELREVVLNAARKIQSTK